MTGHRSFFLDEALDGYVQAHSPAVDDVQQSLIGATAALGPLARMQVAPDQAAFLAVLVAAVRPSFAVEVGTFTGFSSLAIARALPAGGRLLCCDVSTEWTDIAQPIVDHDQAITRVGGAALDRESQAGRFRTCHDQAFTRSYTDQVVPCTGYDACFFDVADRVGFVGNHGPGLVRDRVDQSTCNGLLYFNLITTGRTGNQDRVKTSTTIKTPVV